tara:strand:- start:48253 stop:49014 length:762 start_codon:yes stop_codon:yes gene_type:complete
MRTTTMKPLTFTTKLLALIALNTCFSNAAIIKAHFDGITTNHTNDTVSIDMTFDTSSITSKDTSFSREFFGRDWLSYSLTLNGVTYDYDNLGVYNDYKMRDYATLTNAKPNNNNSGTHDHLILGTHVYANENTSEFSQYIYSYSYIDMLSLNPNFLKSLTLEDLIYSEYNSGDTIAFTGFYYLHYREYDKLKQENISYVPKNFNSFNITDFYFQDVTPTTTVAEPKTFGIFVFCGLLLVIRAQRKSASRHGFT